MACRSRCRCRCVPVVVVVDYFVGRFLFQRGAEKKGVMVVFLFVSFTRSLLYLERTWIAIKCHLHLHLHLRIMMSRRGLRPVRTLSSHHITHSFSLDRTHIYLGYEWKATQLILINWLAHWVFMSFLRWSFIFYCILMRVSFFSFCYCVQGPLCSGKLPFCFGIFIVFVCVRSAGQCQAGREFPSTCSAWWWWLTRILII